MNKGILKDLMVLKLKTMDKMLEGIPIVSESPVRKIFEDFVDVVNEATEDYIKERDLQAKDNKKEKNIKNIEIQ
mgnify:CR=1 FL=1